MNVGRDAPMVRYVVTQEHEELWWVSNGQTNLYRYATEEAAREAALALARDAAEQGTPVSVMVMPPNTDVEVEDTRVLPRFSGM